MKKGDKATLDGQELTIVWTSDEMTDEERYQSHLRAAEFMEGYGISGAFQRHMAEQYRSKLTAS
jgi:hypothetical protein